MFLVERLSASRLVALGVSGALAASATLVTAAPARAVEVYARPLSNTVKISGHGFGHGHGMSQWGAYGAAAVGKLSWQKIVAFYYPGTKLTNLGNPTMRVRLDAVGSGPVSVFNAAGLRLASGGATVALPQVTGARATAVTSYRVRSLPATGRVRVEKRSSAGWQLYRDVTSPAAFSNQSRGTVDVQTGYGRRAYRGSIYASRATSTSMRAISVLPMETYLRAVVPAEMPASWHPDALRAQAVAARSYANYDRVHTPAGRPWNTCDTTSCQMYSGVPAEYPSSTQAVAATAGQTLTYLGRAAFTQFTAANGGWTVAGGQPYLVARVDPYDGAIPNGANSWTASITVARIEARWPAIGTYRQLRILSREGHGSWGGNVLAAVIDGSKGSVAVTGATIRYTFGLRSEWFIPTNVPANIPITLLPSRSAPSYPRDFSGDHKPDVLAVVAGTGALRMYAGNGTSGWRSSSLVGTGFGGFSKVLTAGTWNADALSDVMAQRPDGTLWLFPGTASDRLGRPHKIGTGFGAFNLVFPTGDFSGDGRSDILARRPDGRLTLYPGNGTGGFLPHRTIGTGWNRFTSVLSPGDFNGDHRSDVVARSSNGRLYLYPGNGSGGWLPPRLIGRGWNVFSAIVSSGDVNGDHRSDLLCRAKDGTLWLYPGNGRGGFLQRKVVARGWNVFSNILR